MSPNRCYLSVRSVHRPRKVDKRRAPLKRRGGSGRGDSASLERTGAANRMNSSPRLMPTAGPAPTPRISIRPTSAPAPDPVPQRALTPGEEKRRSS